MGSDPQAAKTIQNNLKELLKNIKKYDEHRFFCFFILLFKKKQKLNQKSH